MIEKKKSVHNNRSKIYVYIANDDVIRVADKKATHNQLLRELGYKLDGVSDKGTRPNKDDDVKFSLGYAVGTTALVYKDLTNCDVDTVVKRLEALDDFDSVMVIEEGQDYYEKSK